MEAEYEALLKNNTWTLVKRPENVPIVDNEWVYRIKRDVNGKIVKLKSRLVARGFGFNYWDTYAPVIKYSTLRLLMAVEKNFLIEQIDIKNANVNSDLKELVYNIYYF